MELWIHAEGSDESLRAFLALPESIHQLHEKVDHLAHRIDRMEHRVMATIEETAAAQLALIDNIKGDLDNIKNQLAVALAGGAAAHEAGIQEALAGLQVVTDRLTAVDAETPPVEAPPVP